MFLPGRNAEQERADKQRILKRVEGWAEELIPENFRPDCTVSVQEVQCGDPNCAPIDTLVTLIFQRYVCAVYLQFDLFVDTMTAISRILEDGSHPSFSSNFVC